MNSKRRNESACPGGGARRRNRRWIHRVAATILLAPAAVAGNQNAEAEDETPALAEEIVVSAPTGAIPRWTVSAPRI